ncbi:hypothetical protein HLV37_02595 [Eggerthellaceae bacterium zg-1084]|uniref:chloride channel protein n=1 Tax=Berryella wangjianweii TaxID=2734634 RepID=UPI0015572BBC|nr:chloride channel protein [Berryella wangjianweii]NPD30768.1 hypothetical protein [Berryella wangjianweii]
MSDAGDAIGVAGATGEEERARAAEGSCAAEGACTTEGACASSADSEGAASLWRHPVRWLGGALACGAVGGAVAVMLSEVARLAEQAFRVDIRLGALLPLLVAASWLAYRVLGARFSTGTLDVVAAARLDRPVSPRVAPAIVAATALTLVGGGSVGKEGAALQAGGSLAAGLAARLRLGPGSYRVMVSAGMVGAFAALMGAPFAAIAFVVEVVRPSARELRDARIVCLPAAALAAWGVTLLAGGRGSWAHLVSVGSWTAAVPEVACIAVIGAAFGFGFTITARLVHGLSKELFGSQLTRLMAGAVLVVALLAFGGWVASGTGATQIEQAFSGLPVGFSDALWKVQLTAVCLGFGMKGGEIMPSLCVGALAGAAWAHMTGAPIDLACAVGMIASFSASTRCPVAAALLALEWFGPACALFALVAAGVGYLPARSLNLYDGLSWDIPLLAVGSSGPRRARAKGGASAPSGADRPAASGAEASGEADSAQEEASAFGRRR